VPGIVPAMTTLDYIRNFADDYLAPVGLRLIVALVVFFFGRAIAKALLRGLDRMMERSKIDVSLRKFLNSVTYAVLLVAIVIAALDTIGVKTTAVVAVLGAAGLAIGLALQGSLSNFAAGVMLIILRPYKVGDLVVIGKYLGRVDAIKVFQTIVVTGDNREVTIPNGQIIAAPIENLTVLGKRRVDLVVTVAHGPTSDLAQIKKLLEGVVTDDPRIDSNPKPAVELAEITDANIKLNFRPWTSAGNHGAVACEMMEKVKDALQGAGLKYTVALAPVA
jgi:small conductance mechanosensitive channel